MKTMKIEKKLSFEDRIQNIKDLQVKETLTYKKEPDGIRAIGPMEVKGVYMTDQQQLKNFQETLDMDVLAPNHKLDNESFSLKINNFKGVIEDDGINLLIEISIAGLKDEKKEGSTNTNGVGGVYMPDILKTVANNPVSKAAPIEEKSPVVSTKMETISSLQGSDESDIEGNGEEAIDISEIEDIFEDADTTYTSYRMVVAKANDSYDSIANRYEVDEQALRNTNKNKDVIEKSLIILPF